ncbi:MAG: glutathione S-transferase [Rhizobiales bacterium]|nr:glutathione S-transferase [Hyphomicrobiales bacterium]
MTPDARPVLYSFRRCPYAMRARMAIAASNTICEIREVSLKDKPEGMVTASPKATVPVLVMADDTVIDQSLEIMLWTLGQNDPHGWLTPETGDLDAMLALIDQTEDPFKIHLDRYKYSVRYEGADPAFHRTEAVKFLEALDSRLEDTIHLFGDRPALADYAIFPFIRQFANTDRDWFDALSLPALQAWLETHLASDLFKSIMAKRAFWHSGQVPELFPSA